MSDILGVQKAEASAAADFNALLTRVEALEAKGAADEQAIVAQVIAGLQPPVMAACEAVNTLTVTVSAATTELLGTVRSLNGAKVELTLGPEGQ